MLVVLQVEPRIVFECRMRIRAALKVSAPRPSGVMPSSMYAPVITGRIVTAAKRKVEQLSTDSDEEEEEAKRLEAFGDSLEREAKDSEAEDEETKVGEVNDDEAKEGDEDVAASK